jgi:endonuclease/exonuclease/phosphatase (EEP) superfamily protein YafD
MTLLMWLNILTGLLLAAGTLLSLSSHPHWFVRGWDFPRVQIAGLAALSGIIHATFFSAWRPWDWIFLGAVVATAGWQAYRILPYTPLAASRTKRAASRRSDCKLKLLIANVQMENREFERFIDTIAQCDPDVVLALETDAAWNEQLKVLEAGYPYMVRQPQSNCYGMLLASRLPIVASQVRFLVQNDIPSIRAELQLSCGARVRLYGLHPRPPEPIRDQDSKPRDAELVIVGKEIEKDSAPTIVAGDLNDVAWSPTSELFLRISGLLDARIGRGMYNSWNANNRLMRFPLDHIFHSNHFTLDELKILSHIGSDHFPVYAALSYEPEAQAEQPETAKAPGDDRQAAQKIERESRQS